MKKHHSEHPRELVFNYNSLLQKKNKMNDLFFLCIKLMRRITFWGAKIEEKFFYKKWTILL